MRVGFSGRKVRKPTLLNVAQSGKLEEVQELLDEDSDAINSKDAVSSILFTSSHPFLCLG